MVQVSDEQRDVKTSRKKNFLMTTELIKIYSHKIKTPEELKKIIGPLPRQKKVVMCHGVFDVIHPGHLRHLLYAKSKADLLIVSLTADIHISKGKYRPHVPQQLRAANMAAYEFVDYVVIDVNSKPLENISIIQPDFFGKGYEYTKEGNPHPRTQEEIDTLQKYGGQIIFTPGDYVLSSSRLIEASPPDIKYDKLEMLLNFHGISFDDLRATLKNISGKKVHVIGDTIVDSYTHCAMIGGQTKTPTMSVLFEEKKDFLGGAGIVAKHMKAAGANVVFSTVLGDDAYKDFVTNDLKESGVECKIHIDSLRPTVNKNAIVVNDYRLLKIDTLDNATIPESIIQKMGSDIEKIQADAIVFSDFRHGIFNKKTIPFLSQHIPKGMLKVADSQVASRWGNITEFRDFDIVTPNEREARFALADQDSGIRPLAEELHKKTDCKYLILKMGDRGVLCSKSQLHQDMESFFLVDSFVEQLVDPVGAGDALLAYGTLAFLASNSIEQAVILGSIAAACLCEHNGNVPVKPEDILKKLNQIECHINLDLAHTVRM